MTTRTLFIINPAAGARRAAVVWQDFERSLRKEGWKPEHVFSTAPGEAQRLARAATDRFEIVVAVGGDGTISEVADGILNAAPGAAAAAVVPCGTGNDFAGTLGVPTLSAAREALVRGHTRRVDVIEVECRLDNKPLRRHALLFAGVGIASETLKQTSPMIKSLFGRRFAYPVGLLRALWNYRAPRLRVTVNGTVREDSFLFAGVSNSERAGGGLKLAPGARIDDGRLDVNLVQALGRWEAFGQVRRLAQGRHTAHPKVQYFSTLNLEIDAPEPLDVAADGELIGFTPARFEVRPGALAVLVQDEALK